MRTKSGVRLLTLDEAQAAGDEWGFNCGPAALCAVLELSPADIRPHLGDFEKKRYTNPTLMASILRGLGINFRRVYECAVQVENRKPTYPSFGLVRVQWGGPWTKPGVPMAARYRHTHWIAVRDLGREAFDVNALCCNGGWLPWQEWADELTPWLIRQCEPKADGSWWPTHCWEVG